ncbi:MAG: PQQ-like beta-propeller repeat protein [Anaerolineae bacterium]|nr:PQQ-like beta-propeller repeat protein [Anaerolineae bacterium]
MNLSRTRRWPVALAVLAALLLGVSGCAGGARASSWTGLTIVGESLYAADLQQVVVLDTADGSPLWAFPENLPGNTRWGFPADLDQGKCGFFYVTPAVGEGRVIVASQTPGGGFGGRPRNIVWGLDPDTGQFWHFAGATGQYIEGGAISDGVFVIGNSDGNVYALDVESGALKWVFETGHRVWATPLIISDTVYIGSMDRHLYALDLSTGEERWSFQAEGAFAGTPALWNDTLFIGAFDDRFYAVDARTGAERWHFAGENWFWGSPVVYDDTVFVADVNGNVYAIDAKTGDQIWRQALNAQVRAGPALAEDGNKLFVGSQKDGTLYALDTADGFMIWSQESEGQALSTPAVSGAMVYETLIYGPHHVIARHVDNGREMWAYPQVVEE